MDFTYAPQTSLFYLKTIVHIGEWHLVSFPGNEANLPRFVSEKGVEGLFFESACFVCSTNWVL